MNLRFWSDVTPSALPIRLELAYPNNPKNAINGIFATLLGRASHKERSAGIANAGKRLICFFERIFA